MTNDNSFATRYDAETLMFNQRNGAVVKRDAQIFISMLNAQLQHGNITEAQHASILTDRYPTCALLDAMHQVLQNRKHNGQTCN